MALKIYNTYSKELEAFTPIEPGRVRMYNCGPTVYDSPHVGNFRTFLFADTLRRYLEYAGYRVTQVMNITDVGHLTRDDVEAGVDKMEEGLRRLREKGVKVNDPYEVARYYEKEYFGARELLGFKDAEHYPRATEHVPEMIEIIKVLLAKGHAYLVNGNIYFEVATFPAYGRLSGNTQEQIKAGARVEVNPEKRHPADFALWKTDANHLMQFDSPWGRGFPGWHIECSAMSRKYLGEELDIHTGGEDNIFPHHECEIAQSEASTGKRFVRYWMHARHLLWGGKKMSKSEGTFFTIAQLADRWPARAIRYALTSTQYRMQVNYTDESFASAVVAVARLRDFRMRLVPAAGALADECARAKEAFARAMDDDLNVSGALAAVHDFVSDVNRLLDRGTAVPGALETLLGFDSVFGFLEAEEEAPPEIRRKAEERVAARKAKQWKESDRLRDELKAAGWIVEDTKDGYKLKRVR